MSRTRRSTRGISAAGLALALLIAVGCGPSRPEESIVEHRNAAADRPPGPTQLAASSSPIPTAAPVDAAPVDAAPTIADANDDGHRRILFVGDSLIDRATAELDATFAAHRVEAQYRGYTNTGLLTQFPEDHGATWWSTQLATALVEVAPDVVVFQSCCNYDGSYVGPDTSHLPPDSEAHYERWHLEALMLTEAARATGATVVWILSPSALPGTDVPWPLSRIERYNEIYRSLGVAVVDWQAALGEAQPTATERLRGADGVHLTDAGDRVVVAATWRALTSPSSLPIPAS